MTTTIAEENKRVAPRARVLKGAKVVLLNQWSLIDCTVRDLSETGAKLLCADPLTIPNEFRFLLPAENTIREARVAWRRDGMVGIEFTSEKTKAPMRKLSSSF
jgi:PilZ domain